MKKFCFVLLLLCLSVCTKAQESESPSLRYAKVTLLSDKEVIGEVISLSDTEIELDTDIGVLYIDRADTKNLQLSDQPFHLWEELEVGPPDKEERWYSDWNQVAPTAKPTGKGKINYRNDYLVLNRFSFGVSDNISVDAGFEVASLFEDELPRFFVQPKVSFRADQSYFSIGTLVLISPESVDMGFLSFANYTIDVAGSNYTFGIGKAYSMDEFGDRPILLSFATTQRAGKHTYVSAEVFGGVGEYMAQLGVLIRTRSNVVFRFGLLRPISNMIETTLGAPLLGLSVPLR